MSLAVPTWRRSSRSIALAWQSCWAMPRLPAGFEARSRDLASTADPISILPNPLPAAAMIVARLGPSIKSPTPVTSVAPDRKQDSSRSGAIWQRLFRYREHRGKAIRVADVEQHRLGDFTCYPAGREINHKQRLAALDFRFRVGAFPTQACQYCASAIAEVDRQPDELAGSGNEFHSFRSTRRKARWRDRRSVNSWGSASRMTGANGASRQRRSPSSRRRSGT